MTSRELFDAKRFLELKDDSSRLYFIQSECRRNRIEAVREFAEEMRKELLIQPRFDERYIVKNAEILGHNLLAVKVNNKITQALAELEGEIEEVE